MKTGTSQLAGASRSRDCGSPLSAAGSRLRSSGGSPSPRLRGSGRPGVDSIGGPGIPLGCRTCGLLPHRSDPRDARRRCRAAAAMAASPRSVAYSSQVRWWPWFPGNDRPAGPRGHPGRRRVRQCTTRGPCGEPRALFAGLGPHPGPVRFDSPVDHRRGSVRRAFGQGQQRAQCCLVPGRCELAARTSGVGKCIPHDRFRQQPGRIRSPRAEVDRPRLVELQAVADAGWRGGCAARCASRASTRASRSSVRRTAESRARVSST